MTIVIFGNIFYWLIPLSNGNNYCLFSFGSRLRAKVCTEVYKDLCQAS